MSLHFKRGIDRDRRCVGISTCPAQSRSQVAAPLANTAPASWRRADCHTVIDQPGRTESTTGRSSAMPRLASGHRQPEHSDRHLDANGTASLPSPWGEFDQRLLRAQHRPHSRAVVCASASSADVALDGVDFEFNESPAATPPPAAAVKVPRSFMTSQIDLEQSTHRRQPHVPRARRPAATVCLPCSAPLRHRRCRPPGRLGCVSCDQAGHVEGQLGSEMKVV